MTHALVWYREFELSLRGHVKRTNYNLEDTTIRVAPAEYSHI